MLKLSIPRRAILASARPRPTALVHPLLRRPLLPGPQGYQRHFSASSRLQVQYTRFSDGHTYQRRRPDQVPTILVVGVVVAGVGVYYVAHLEQVPETGRWRFMATSPRLEARLQKSTYASLQSEFEGRILPSHHPVTRFVHRVVADLLESSDLGTLRSTNPRKPSTDDGFWPEDPFVAAQPTSSDAGVKEWNLLVVDDPKIVNALATFGTIVVFTGILPVCRDEAGLAGVVSHEIGHSVARHSSERYSSNILLFLSVFMLQVVGLDFGVARMLNYLLFQLPNSRTQELEADTLGMRIAAKACYDPRSTVEMHTRLARASESGGVGSTFEFLRTHPGPEHRIKHLEELVPEAYEIRAANPRCAGVRGSIDQFFAGMSRWD